MGMPQGYVRKILLIMRLTTVILIATLMQVSASTLAQRVTLNERKASLEEILKSIREQSGYDMVLDRKLLFKVKPIDVNVKNVSVKDALDIVFKAQPLTFTIEDKTILIAEKELSLVDRLVNVFKEIDVKGRIVDAGGMPLPGATITVNNSKPARRTISNANGEFNLQSVSDDAILSISYLGYQTRTVSAKGNLGAIVLEPINSELDEVQVQGYGLTNKRFGTGNISTIKGDVIEKQPITNPILALAGRMSGVFITEGSGTSGANFNIVIQGQNSIAAGKLPLYIIDGVPFGSKPVERTVGAIAAAPSIVGTEGFSPLNSLSPNDIESVSILKDADATAIYGSRAANGVVLITTKTGKKGKTKIDAEVYSGASKVVRTLPMLNAQQYLNMRTQAFANDKITPTALNAPDLMVFNNGGDTDMQELILKTGRFTNANLTVSGGEQNTQFLVAGNFRRETPVVMSNFSQVKVQGRFNVQHHSSNQKFRFNANASINRDESELPAASLVNVFDLPPNLPVYNADGSLNWQTGYNNPVAPFRNIYNHTVFNLLSNVGLSYELIKGLNLKADLGYNRFTVDDLVATLRSSKNPALANSATGGTTMSSTTNELYQIEPQLTYNRTLGKGRLEALIGGTYQYTHSVQPYFITGSITTDALYNDLGSIAISLKANGEAESKYDSFFGRLNYNWDKKYILNASYRIDGSSKFPPGYRYGKFGSIGAAWIFSEEQFFKNRQWSWFSFGKLRSSYGSIGNDQVSDYGYVAPYTSTATAYGGVNGIYIPRLANPANYSWETTKKFNLSLDLGFFNERILLNASYFRNQTNNLLMNNLPIASQSGFAGYLGNLPGIKIGNKGLELELSTHNLNRKDFSWRTSINFTLPENKLLDYPGLENTTFVTSMVIGKSLNLLTGYIYTGFENGLPTVKDVNNDGKITTGLSENGRGDYVVLGNSDPKFYGGINNSFSYKGFQLDFLFQFVKKDGANIYRELALYPGANSNFAASILDYPFIYSTVSNSDASKAYLSAFKLSDRGFSDASFIRLKNISLGYSFPKSWLKPVKVNTANLYVRAQNLLTITNYNGLDPETMGVNMPPLKLITVGLQASF